MRSVPRGINFKEKCQAAKLATGRKSHLMVAMDNDIRD